MKKKRFVKLVMSCGIQRNQAKRMALGVVKCGSYEALYKHYHFVLNMHRPVLALRSFGKTARALAKQFGKFKTAFMGADFASGPDQTATVHHPYGVWVGCKNDDF